MAYRLWCVTPCSDEGEGDHGLYIQGQAEGWASEDGQTDAAGVMSSCLAILLTEVRQWALISHLSPSHLFTVTRELPLTLNHYRRYQEHSLHWFYAHLPKITRPELRERVIIEFSLVPRCVKAWSDLQRTDFCLCHTSYTGCFLQYSIQLNPFKFGLVSIWVNH